MCIACVVCVFVFEVHNHVFVLLHVHCACVYGELNNTSCTEREREREFGREIEKIININYLQIN